MHVFGMDADTGLLSAVSSALPTPFSVKNILNLTEQANCALDFQQGTMNVNYQTPGGYGAHHAHHLGHGHHPHGHHHHHLTHPMVSDATMGGIGAVSLSQTNMLQQMQDTISSSTSSCEYGSTGSLLHPGGPPPPPAYSPYNDLTPGTLARLGVEFGLSVGSSSPPSGNPNGTSPLSCRDDIIEKSKYTSNLNQRIILSLCNSCVHELLDGSGQSGGGGGLRV